MLGKKKRKKNNFNGTYAQRQTLASEYVNKYYIQ